VFQRGKHRGLSLAQVAEHDLSYLRWLREVLVMMSDLPNVRAWFSCDRHTQLPPVVPPNVRIAWLMMEHDDLPPAADLVFRVHRLRRVARKKVPCSAASAGDLSPHRIRVHVSR